MVIGEMIEFCGEQREKYVLEKEMMFVTRIIRKILFLYKCNRLLFLCLKIVVIRVVYVSKCPSGPPVQLVYLMMKYLNIFHHI
jgi:hypothetical protein